MSEISDIIEKLVQFRDERDWDQFHNVKDLAIAINIESGELLELFLWKEEGKEDASKVKEELADILIYCFLLADKYKVDITRIIFDKLELNREKYPVEKAKGNSRKYNEM